MARRKTPHEKLESVKEPCVEQDPRGRGLMLIPTGIQVDALVREVQRGKLITVDRIRDHLAKQHRADFTCPLVTGIMLRVAAEAAEEDRQAGRADITPWWRVVKSDGKLNPKFPGGVEAQAVHLRAEGHTVGPSRGKQPPRVVGFEKVIQHL